MKRLQTLAKSNQVSANDLIEVIVSKGHAQGMDALNAAQQTVFLIADLDSESAINGLLGYYSNSAGNHAIEVVEALKQIGAIESADLIKTANAQFPNTSPPSDRAERNQVLQTLDESAEQRIEEAGNTFMERPDDLGEKYEAFILANLAELTQ